MFFFTQPKLSNVTHQLLTVFICLNITRLQRHLSSRTKHSLENKRYGELENFTFTVCNRLMFTEANSFLQVAPQASSKNMEQEKIR